MSHGFEILPFATPEAASQAYDDGECRSAQPLDVGQARRLVGQACDGPPADFAEWDRGCLIAEIQLNEIDGRLLGIIVEVHSVCDTAAEEIDLVLLLADMAEQLGCKLHDVSSSRMYEAGRAEAFLGIERPDRSTRASDGSQRWAGGSGLGTAQADGPKAPATNPDPS